MRQVSVLLLLFISVLAYGQETSAPGRWSAAKANAWYAKEPFLVGANYVPANAINELEMFQAETFDPATIDKELAMAEGIGMNTMRVFLHDLLWQQDAEGFKKTARSVSGYLRQTQDPAHAGAVRFVLGPVSEARQTARAGAGYSQFGLGTKPRCRCADRCVAASAARSLRERHSGRVQK